MSRSTRALAVVALLVAVTGCRRSRLSPEDQVRKAIDSVVLAVRERDMSAVVASVSDQYADREGNDKKQLVSLVRVQFLVHPNLYLAARIASVECPERVQAQVVVYAAMVSVPAGVVPDLRQFSADVYRFDLTMVDEDGAWRVVRAAWHPATTQDLLDN